MTSTTLAWSNSPPWQVCHPGVGRAVGCAHGRRRRRYRAARAPSALAAALAARPAARGVRLLGA
eukprot:4696906-Prymnesium_polylepis.1